VDECKTLPDGYAGRLAKIEALCVETAVALAATLLTLAAGASSYRGVPSGPAPAGTV
jgi:hypothetical protein